MTADASLALTKSARGPEALVVELVDIGSLELDPSNRRLHPERNLAAIAASLERFGQRKPVVVWRGRVMAGNGTALAARDRLGWSQLAVARCPDGWSEDEARAFAIADNRTGELAVWDEPGLAADLVAVRDRDAELFGSLGFADEDIDAMLARIAAREPATVGADPELVPSAPASPITTRGDVWVLGDHRVMCGDCRDADDVDRLIDGRAVNVAFTSPPYASMRQYDPSSGFEPIAPAAYVEWFAPVAAHVARVLASDGSWFVNIKPDTDGLDTQLYVFDLVLAHAREWDWHFATEFCWERVGMPQRVVRRFKNQFEPVYQFTLGEWKIRPHNVQHASDSVPIPGGPGAGQTSWAVKIGDTANFTQQGDPGGDWFKGRTEEGLAYPGNRLPAMMSTHQAVGHNAAFPVGLPAWFMRAYSDPGDLVYDPFVGSGSTVIAGHQQSRAVCGMELSPRYVDIVCRRYQQHTGTLPILERTGATVDFTDD